MELGVSSGAGPRDAAEPPSQRYGEAEAAALWREHFGDVAQVTKIASESDAVFRMSQTNGDYLLRLTDDRSVADLQVAILDHIAVVPGLPVPKVRPSLTGAAIIEAPSVDGATSTAFVTSFLPGKPLAAFAPSSKMRGAVFGLLNRLDRSLEGFIHAGAKRSILWDVSRAGQVAPLLEAVPDLTLRALASQAIADWTDLAAPLLQRLPRQVIHNDFNPSNILVAEDGEISGVIDFGDVIEAPRVCDLATAIAYQQPADGFDALIAEAVAAYGRERPLGEVELTILPSLVRARAAMVVAITHMRAARHPDNQAYFLRNAPLAANLLAAAAGGKRPLRKKP